MNHIATSATTSRQKRVRTDPITTTQMIDLMTPASTTRTNRSLTKSAIQALEDATASLPSRIHPLVSDFCNKLISIRSKQITKENSAKRMTKEPNYIPKSAKASDFKITLSKGASEDLYLFRSKGQLIGLITAILDGESQSSREMVL